MTDNTTPTPAEAQPTTGTATPGEGMFTQADVDRIVGDRLSRERQRYADYDDLKAAAEKATTLQGEYEEVLGKHSKAEHQLRMERAARRHGLDDELMGFLSGETDEEVDAKAQTLAAKLSAATPAAEQRPGPRPDPTQGQGSDMALNGDPLLESLKNTLGIP